MPGTQVPFHEGDDPDDWWHTQSAERKRQIARWVSGGPGPRQEVEGQLSIEDAGVSA